jgi:hypothetical protein
MGLPSPYPCPLIRCVREPRGGIVWANGTASGPANGPRQRLHLRCGIAAGGFRPSAGVAESQREAEDGISEVSAPESPETESHEDDWES